MDLFYIINKYLMKKLWKNTIYSILLFLLLNLNYVNAALSVKGTKNPTTLENTGGGDFVSTIESIVWYIIWLLYLVAVIFGLYAWFQILTAWWDEEKVKKWKTTMINVAIWLIVIFLSSSIINWLIENLAGWVLVNVG